MQKLLKTSANHYEICKDIIRYISKDYPDFAYEMIKNINLDEYRDYSIALLLNNYFKNRYTERYAYYFFEDLRGSHEKDYKKTYKNSIFFKSNIKNIQKIKKMYKDYF